MISPSFFARPALEVAPELLGMSLLVAGVGGVIVEVEAYDQTDPASHSHRGPTPSNRSMFGPPGRAYVYRSYGMHWCLNFVCEVEGHGAGVLVRALRPTKGLAAMRARRGVEDELLLCSGPGRLGQALAIDKRLDGKRLDRPPFRLLEGVQPVVAASPRIGISRAAAVPWRFFDHDSPFVSGRRRRSPTSAALRSRTSSKTA